MAFDINHLNAQQLDELINQAQKRKSELKKENLSATRDEVLSLLRKAGYSADEIFGGTRGKRAVPGTTTAPKFRNPTNPNETWAGRGKRPQWFTAALSSGKSVDELRA